jgi:2-iminobutanoate/2-iminopropanoate deaminase
MTPRFSRAQLSATALLLPLFLGGCVVSAGSRTTSAPGSTPANSAGPHKEILVPGGGERPLFSTVIRSGNVLYLSGVVGRSADGDAGAATRQALEGVKQRLERVNHTMADVIKCTVYLVDMEDYAAMNEVYLEFFPSEPPARTAVAVRALPVNAQVEVDCIAAAR